MSTAKRGFTDGYLAMGQAWGDYDNDGRIDLYVTGGQAPSVLYHNQGDGTFAESALSVTVSLPDRWTGGAVWADYDNDGWRALYVLVHGANVLFHNNGGSFTEVTPTDWQSGPQPTVGMAYAHYNFEADPLVAQLRQAARKIPLSMSAIAPASPQNIKATGRCLNRASPPATWASGRPGGLRQRRLGRSLRHRQRTAQRALPQRGRWDL
ncbi:MAG: VCBS repeat-containing protein [Caldilineaceae bacterium]